MSFKKFNEMELALLASIANLTAEGVEDIEMEKGDYAPVTMEDCTSTSFYLTTPDSTRRSLRRKNTFRKKEEQKTLAQSLGYDLSTKDNSHVVRELLSASHTDRTYLRGEKAESKHTTVKKEISMMDKENWEKARNELMQTHDAILGGIACDLETLSLDMRDNEYSIENLEKEYEALREEMELVAEKLKNAKLRKNGIQAALVQNKSDFATLSANFEKERIRRFGW